MFYAAATVLSAGRSNIPGILTAVTALASCANGSACAGAAATAPAATARPTAAATPRRQGLLLLLLWVGCRQGMMLLLLGLGLVCCGGAVVPMFADSWVCKE